MQSTPAAASDREGQRREKSRTLSSGPRPVCPQDHLGRGSSSRHSTSALALLTARDKHREDATLPHGAASERENNVLGISQDGYEPLLSAPSPPPHCLSSGTLRRA